MVKIIDASVAIKWFIKEHGREKALRILSDIFSDPGNFAVPELFYFELTHIFNRLIPRATDIQNELLTEIINLGIHRFSMTKELMLEIQAFQQMGLSGYDGAYVALAKILQGKWITFDKKAHTLITSLNLSELL